MTTKFDYDASDNQSMAIFVKKIVKKNVQKANIKRVIIALSGGPGQTTRDMEPFVFSQWNDNSIMDDSVFVCADHRFTGKSGSVDDSYVKSDDLNLINQTNQTHKIARGLSSIHAAKDYVEVLKAMMKEYGSAEFYFLGISYGTIVAQRASKIALENNIKLNGILMGGALGPGDGVFPTAERDFAALVFENCKRNEFCNGLLEKHFKGIDILRAPSLLDTLSNDCIAHLRSKSSNIKRYVQIITTNAMSRIRKTKRSSDGRVVAFQYIFHMLKCPSLETFKVIDAALNALFKSDLSELSLPNNAIAAGKRKHSLNEVVYHQIAGSEFDVYSTGTCKNKFKDSLHYACDALDKNKKSLSKFANVHYTLSAEWSGDASLPVITPGFKVLIVSGELDLNTFAEQSRILTKKLVAKAKARGYANAEDAIVHVNLLNRDHSSFYSSSCANNSIIEEFFGIIPKGSSQACVEKENSRTLDWRQDGLYKAYKINNWKGFLDRDEGLSNAMLALIIVGCVAALILVFVGVFFVVRSMRKKRQQQMSLNSDHVHIQT